MNITVEDALTAREDSYLDVVLRDALHEYIRDPGWRLHSAPMRDA